MRTYTRKKKEHKLIEGVKELCRLCLGKTEKAISIFPETQNISTSLAVRIMFCVGLEVTKDDNLPNHVCAECEKQLQSCYIFRKKCETTYQKLKSHLVALKTPAVCLPKPLDMVQNVQDLNGQDIGWLGSKTSLKRYSGSAASSLDDKQALQLSETNGDDKLNYVQIVSNNLPYRYQVDSTQNPLTREKDISKKDTLQLVTTGVVNETRVSPIVAMLDQSRERIKEIHIETAVDSSIATLLKSPMATSIITLVEESRAQSPVVELREEPEVRIHEELMEVLIETPTDTLETSKRPQPKKTQPINNHQLQNPDNEANNLTVVVAEEPETELPGFVQSMMLQLGLLSARGVEPGVRLELEAADGSLLTLAFSEEEDCEAPAASPPGLNLEYMVTKDSPSLEPPKGESAGRWCAACGKTFASRAVLARHARLHSGERPHACRQCPRRFAQRDTLARHRLVHLERRPFQCAWCPKSFTQRSSLSAHGRSHAAPPARPLALHRCPRCPKLFLYPSGLSRHIMMHKGRVYTCAACERSFRDRSSLARHRNTAHHRANVASTTNTP